MSRYVFVPGFDCVVQPDNVDFYVQVNPGSFEVKKLSRGWKPLDKKRWTGQIPIKAKLVERKSK